MGCTHQVTPPAVEHRFSTAKPVLHLISCQFTWCTHAILSPFLSFYCTFQPFLILISPSSLQFYMYFTYIKYCMCYIVYICIWYLHTYTALLLSQAAAVSCCKEFSSQALKSAVELKDPYCVCRNNALVMGTSTSAPTTGYKHRGLSLRGLWLCLCSHILLPLKAWEFFH